MHPETENKTIVATGGGLKKRGGGAISALTLDGGAGGATAVLNNSTDGTGSDIWALRAPAGDSKSISFPKPIPFTSGLYLTLVPSGTDAKLSIALDG